MRAWCALTVLKCWFFGFDSFLTFFFNSLLGLYSLALKSYYSNVRPPMKISHFLTLSLIFYHFPFALFLGDFSTFSYKPYFFLFLLYFYFLRVLWFSDYSSEDNDYSSIFDIFFFLYGVCLGSLKQKTI